MQNIAEFFPDSFHLDDAYHMVNINCVKHCPPQELLSMKPLVWKLVKTYDEAEFDQCLLALRSLCPVFYSRYFEPKRLPRKQHWACHISQKGFTGGVIASSYAEATGSAEGAWFQKPRNSLLEVFAACFEKEEFEIKKEETLLGNVVMKVTHGVSNDSPLIVECRARCSAYVTGLVSSELADSINYSAFTNNRVLAPGEEGYTAETSIAFTVKRNIITEKERAVLFTVNLERKFVVSVDSCDCPKVSNCGYPCRHIFAAALLCSTQFSAHVCFEHLKPFFHPRYLLKKSVEFLGKGVEEVAREIGSNNPLCDFDADDECDGGPNQEGAHFSTQVTQPLSQRNKGGRFTHISFDKLRSEASPLFQAGSRNTRLGNALLDLFKSLHRTVLAMSPEDQQTVTAESLVAALKAPAGVQGAPITPHNSTPRLSTVQSDGNIAVVVQDHRGEPPSPPPPHPPRKQTFWPAIGNRTIGNLVCLFLR